MITLGGGLGGGGGGGGGPKAGKDKSGGSGVSQDSIERRAAALAALKLVCESSVLAPHLEALLAGLDAQVRHPS